jgi:hypothetical protein
MIQCLENERTDKGVMFFYAQYFSFYEIIKIKKLITGSRLHILPENLNCTNLIQSF